MQVGDLLLGSRDHFRQVLKVLVMAGLKDKQRNLEIAHVGKIDYGPQTEIFPVAQNAGIGIALQVAVEQPRTIQRCRQRRILLNGLRILLPRGKRIVADEEQRTWFARERIYRKVFG